MGMGVIGTALGMSVSGVMAWHGTAWYGMP